MNPQIVRPAGPVDEKVGVLAARDSSGEIIGLVVNFGCHCTVTEEGTEFSADYVHYLREHLRRAFPNATVVFLLGACGDITQIDNRSSNIEKGHPHADMMGATLASEVARIIPQLTWQSQAACRFANRTVPIAVREADACAPATIGLGSGAMWERIYQHESKLLAQFRRTHPTVDCELCALRIGDLAVVSNGAELFCQPALDIQSASPIPQTWVVTLANEYRGYVPTAGAHYAGGYEVRTARSSFLAVDAAQKLVETSIAALCDLKEAAW